MRSSSAVIPSIYAHQAGEVTYLEQPVGGRPFLRVLGERYFDEAVQVGRPPVLVLQLRRLEPGLAHEYERPHGVQVEHGRLQLRQFDGGDAHSPDVTLLVVAALPLHCCHLSHTGSTRERAQTWKRRHHKGASLNVGNGDNLHTGKLEMALASFRRDGVTGIDNDRGGNQILLKASKPGT